MEARGIAAVALMLAVCGCSHVHRVDPAAGGSELDNLNRAVRYRRVSVERVTGVSGVASAVLRAERVRVAPDTTFMRLLLNPREVEALRGVPVHEARRDTVLSTSAISRMTVTNRLLGAINGALLGLGIGAALGYLSGSDSDDPWSGPGVYAVGFGLVGAGVGMVSGAMIGLRDVYEFAGE